MFEAIIKKRVGLKGGGIDIDLAFSMQRGERVGLIGPSGAGKTSLLRLLAGLEKPESGRIVMNGLPWVDTDTGIFVPAARRNIGFVFQDYALFPNMTLRQNLGFASKIGCGDPRVLEIIDIMELAPHAHQRPSELSGGQKQRAALARALVGNPTLLLMDEPLSALDRKTRKMLWRELNSLYNRYPVTLILVSHDLEEVEALTDRTILMHRGKIISDAARMAPCTDRAFEYEEYALAGVEE